MILSTFYIGNEAVRNSPSCSAGYLRSNHGGSLGWLPFSHICPLPYSDSLPYSENKTENCLNLRSFPRHINFQQVTSFLSETLKYSMPYFLFILVEPLSSNPGKFNQRFSEISVFRAMNQTVLLKNSSIFSKFQFWVRRRISLGQAVQSVKTGLT